MKNFKKGILATLVAAVGVLGAAQSAMAGSATATFQVTATVTTTCTTNVGFNQK